MEFGKNKETVCKLLFICFQKTVLKFFSLNETGNLHFHGLLYGPWDLEQLRRHVHRPEIAQQIADLIDSFITCAVSAENQKPSKTDSCTSCCSNPFPTTTTEMKMDSEQLAYRLNNNRHTESCLKNVFKNVKAKL